MSPHPLPWETPTPADRSTLSPARPDLHVVADRAAEPARADRAPVAPGPAWPGQEIEPASSTPETTSSAVSSLHERVHTGIQRAGREFVSELRFVRERPNSLLDHIAYARHGEWSTRTDGWQRRVALAWAYTAAIPISTVAYLSVWAVARPGRAAAALAAVSTTATALNGLPVLGWFVPDWLTIPYWLGL